MKKLGLICLVLVIAVGSMGFAYAKWSQNFNVGGTVQTGSYIVGFDTATLSTGTSGAPATCTVATTPAPSSSAFTINIDKAYPGWNGTVTYTIKNTGTIPAKVSAITLSGTGGTTVTGSSPSWNLTLNGGSGTDVIITINPGIRLETPIPAQVGTTPGTAIGVMTIQIPSGLANTEAGLNGYFTFQIDTQQKP